ncbi:MAG TPA: hypothetical protein VIS96_05370 [Terrimicrobiaceae bacterium]
MHSEIKWLFLPIVAAWVLALCAPSVRDAYVNGWRCVLRHALIWKLPAGLALAYGLFQLADFCLLHWRMGRIPDISPLLVRTGPEPVQIALTAILPASESLAGSLNCLVATFPISILCGFLFLANYRGLTAELARALSRRLGIWGWLLLIALGACALAAIAKPLTLLALPELAQILSFREFLLVSSLVNALSFAFEYLLGTCLQVYLLLVAYGWVRGLHFRRARVLHFAVRRMGFVLKWALVIILATFALIHLPIFFEAWITGEAVGWRTFAAAEALARPALATVMLALATVQIRLVLHNDSLRGAVAAHGRFLKRHGLPCLVFLLSAFGLLFLLKGFQHAGTAWLAAALWRNVWAILLEILCAISGGWILASWVCFYKRCEGGAQSITF